MREFPARVWEPALDAEGIVILPLRWSSRPANADDYARRRNGELQAWQSRENKKLLEFMNGG